MGVFSPGAPISPTTISINRGKPSSTSTLILVASATEYFFVIPSGTKKVTWRPRGLKQTLQWALAATESGDVTKFQTLFKGNEVNWDLTIDSDLTIFVQDPINAGTIIEILLWS